MSGFHSNKLYQVARKENIGLCAYENGLFCLLSAIPPGWRLVDNRSESAHKPIGAPVYLEYFPFLRCNFRCRFCFFSNDELSEDLDGRVIREVIQGLLNYCYNHGVYAIYLLGGEPLLPEARDYIEHLITKAFSLGIGINLTTNGVYLDSEWVSLFKKCYVTLNISLLSYTEENYSYLCRRDSMRNRVYDSIRLIDGAYEYGISTNMFKLTLLELDHLIDFINSLKSCGAWVWRNPTCVGQLALNDRLCLTSEEFFNIYVRNKRKISKHVYFDSPFTYVALNAQLPSNDLDHLYVGCNAGIRKAAVMSDGSMYHCFLFRHVKSFLLGNVLDRVWWDTPFATNRQVVKCSNHNCTYKVICSGCPGYVFLRGLNCDDRCPKRIIG